jgi:hypothetical protein
MTPQPRPTTPRSIHTTAWQLPQLTTCHLRSHCHARAQNGLRNAPRACAHTLYTLVRETTRVSATHLHSLLAPQQHYKGQARPTRGPCTDGVHTITCVCCSHQACVCARAGPSPSPPLNVLTPAWALARPQAGSQHAQTPAQAAQQGRLLPLALRPHPARPVGLRCCR